MTDTTMHSSRHGGTTTCLSERRGGTFQSPFPLTLVYFPMPTNLTSQWPE